MKFTKAYKNIKEPHYFEVLLWLVFSIGLILKCIYFQFNTGISFDSPFSKVNFLMWAATAASVVIISSIILLVSNKRRYAVMIAFDIVLSLLLLSDTLYFRYYRNVLTVPCLYQLKLVGSTGDSITNLFRMSDLMYFVDIVLLITAIILIRKLKPGKIIKKLNKKLKLITAVILLLFASLVMVTCYIYSGAGIFKYDNNYAVNRMGIFYFHCYDIQQFVENNVLGDRVLSDKDVQMITAHIQKRRTEDGKSDEKTAGTQKGKNLLVIQLEAMQNFLLYSEVNGREITPNLNKIAGESLYFPNAYYQIAGGNTSDAEFLTNVSLYPTMKGSAYFIYPVNKYHSLPLLLKSEGYETFVAHANIPTFWNRNIMYSNLGFDHYYSELDFNLDKVIGWGLEDKSFFTQCVDKLEGKDPFYAFLISLSSHHPYTMFGKSEFDVGSWNGTILGDYFKAANYVDSAIGLLFETLKEKDMLKDTLIVMYGDHFGMSKEDFRYSAKYLGVDNNELNWIKNDGIPLIIYGEGLEPSVIDKVCGQIDIMPTVSKLMGLESPYSLGKDLLADSPGYAVLRNGTVITNEYVWMGGTEHLYDFMTGKRLDPLEAKDYMEEVEALQKDLDVSDLILYKDALSELDIH